MLCMWSGQTFFYMFYEPADIDLTKIKIILSFFFNTPTCYSTCSGADMWMRFEPPDKSMKIGRMVDLTTLNTKIAGTTKSLHGLVMILLPCENSLISLCVAVLKTENYICPIKQICLACLPDAEVIPRNSSHFCLIRPLWKIYDAFQQCLYCQWFIWHEIMWILDLIDIFM